jgi:hypothetical protein
MNFNIKYVLEERKREVEELEILFVYLLLLLLLIIIIIILPKGKTSFITGILFY